MAFKDILLHLESYPDPTPDQAVEQGLALCRALGTQVTALAPQVSIPLKTNRLADFALSLGEMAKAEEARSRQNAQATLDLFEARAQALGVFGGRLSPQAEVFEIPELTARVARTRDLCVIPYGREAATYQGVAEAMIFSSGRPVVIFRPDGPRFEQGLGTVVVAWDNSRSAAAAVAAAMPALASARKVVVLTVTNEKASARSGAGSDLLRHLERHGVRAEVQEFDSAGAKIGSVLDHVVLRAEADLLVMGAFGQSRAREFILGGATRSMLEAPPAPVFLAH
ncbi:MAG: universal stress protein [Phenylobacterium sp.]|uniref:universal stress protein n=1 Tax=Phenylobacterium sp. TaxID=1871053 RepID=UPI0027211005|nr:universal stress protein [Phenylobacterium sp.]MDO8901892.1 universal stress protein [Phenylobacterium sp.]MDP2212414.1 universal stress protein [Phenylobacterium sp.]